MVGVRMDLQEQRVNAGRGGRAGQVRHVLALSAGRLAESAGEL